MSDSDAVPLRQQVTVGVQIRCERCTQRHPRNGKGQLLGSMGFVPSLNKWGYMPTERWKQREVLLMPGRRKTQHQTTGEIHFSKGIDGKCPRCGRPIRAGIPALARLAAAAQPDARGERSIYIR